MADSAGIAAAVAGMLKISQLPYGSLELWSIAESLAKGLPWRKLTI